MGLVSALVLDPVGEAITNAAREGAAALPALIRRWNRWRLLNLGLSGIALSALVLAHRAPVVVNRSAASLTAHHRRLRGSPRVGTVRHSQRRAACDPALLDGGSRGASGRAARHRARLHAGHRPHRPVSWAGRL